jgi:hypothetical protein
LKPIAPTDPIFYPKRKRFRRFDGRLSLMLDRAQLQLEAATDPEVIAVYRDLVDEL